MGPEIPVTAKYQEPGAIVVVTKQRRVGKKFPDCAVSCFALCSSAITYCVRCACLLYNCGDSGVAIGCSGIACELILWFEVVKS